MAQTNLVLPTFIIPNTTPGIDWENASNILLADSLYATATGSTQVLTVGYVGNLNLSQGDVVTNIVVAVKGYRGSFNTTLQIFYIDDTTGIEYSYPLLPSFQGFDGTNTLWTLPASLFATTFTVDQINNFKLRMIADGELHLDTIEVNVIYTPVGTLPAPVTPTSGETVCCEYVQAQKFQLAQSMTSSDTTCLVQSFDYSDGTPIQITDFSGGAVQADPNDYEALIVIDQGVEGKEENVRITAIDHNFNGTGFTRLSFGSVANRGLAFKWPYTTDVTLRNDHTGTAEVVISNSAPFYDRFLKKCQIGALVSAPISVLLDDATIVSPATKLNFHGSVTVVQDGTDTEEADIYITAGGGTTPPQVVGVGSGTSGNVQVDTLTYTVPVSGLNRGGLIQISTEELVTVTAVDVGGVAAVQVVSQTDVPNNLRSEQWICVAPPLGTQTVTITLSAVAYISSGSEILTGVDPVTPTGSFAGAGGTDLNPTVGVVTTYDNSLIFDGLVTALTPIVYTEGSGQTLQWSHTANTDTRQGGSSVEPSGLQPDAITMDYAITQNTDWVITAVEVKGITTASATGQTGILWEDEGVPLGTAGTVDEVDFTGAGVTASRVGNKVTVNVPGGGSALSLETDGVANGDQTLLNLIAGSGITLTDDGLGGVTIDATGGGSSVGNLAREFDDFVTTSELFGSQFFLSGNFAIDLGSTSSFKTEQDHPGIVQLDGGAGTGIMRGFGEFDASGNVVQGLLLSDNSFDITILARLDYSGGTDWSGDFSLLSPGGDNFTVAIDGVNGVRYDIGAGFVVSGVSVPASGDWFTVRFVYDLGSNTATLYLNSTVIISAAPSVTGALYLAITPGGANLNFLDVDWVDTIYRTISTGGGSEKKVGVGETDDITYLNMQYQFGFGASDSMWDTVGVNPENPMKINFSTADYFRANSAAGFTSLLPQSVNFSGTKQRIFQIVIDTAATSAGINLAGVGFEEFNAAVGASIIRAQGTNAVSIGFVRKDSDGTWYTRCADGAAFTEHLVTISDSATHVLRCEYDPANIQVKFYVDGLLVDTITTDIPAGGTAIGFGCGNGNVADLGISNANAPSFAVEI